MISENKALIETERLLIEYINKTYINDIFNEKNNPEVNEYLVNRSASTVEDLEKWIDSVMKKNGEENVAQFQVINKGTKEFIGLCPVKKIDTPHPEIGLWIKQSAWGKGYGKEMVAALIYRIKKYMKYEYIVYETFEDNIGSRKIVESLGGVQNNEYRMEMNNYYGKQLTHIQYRIY